MRGIPLLFLLLPIAELIVLIEVGSEIGALAVIGLLAAGVFAGLALLRGRGMASLMGARSRLASSDQPGQDVVDRMLLTFGGLLLVIPGFITDAFSLVFLLPWSRRALVRRLLSAGGFQAFGGMPGGSFTVFRSASRSQTRTREGGQIVEGEVLREADPDSQLKGPPQA
jgi:UPF0716 protein FxsA